MIETTSQIKFLESEVMPFLKEQGEDDASFDGDEKPGKDKGKPSAPETTLYDSETGDRLGPRKGPSFSLDRNFPWIQEGLDELSRILEENMSAPGALLDQYREFEPIIKASKTKKVQSLFEPKQPLEVIKRELEYYSQAYYDILNTSNDQVTFPLFEVEASKLKTTLSHKAEEMKQAILEATHNYCIKTVKEILLDYEQMQNDIKKEPETEAILVEVRDLLKEAPQRVENNENLVKQIGKHMLMLVDYCFAYDSTEALNYWSTKQWPLEIHAEISDGTMRIERMEEIFMDKLEREKEQFIKDFRSRQLMLQDIKMFKDLSTSKDFVHLCNQLKNQLEADAGLVAEFNEREALFDLKASEYQELDACNEEFEPYYKLIVSAYDVTGKIKDWKRNDFSTLPSYEEIEQIVNENRRLATDINKQLEENNPEAALAAMQFKYEIDDFRTHLPLIKLIGSNAIQNDDWDEIARIIGQPQLLRDEIKLEKMIEENISNFLTEIEQVVMRAERKQSLRNKLKQLKEEIKEVKIELFDYKNKTYIVKGYVELFTILDDQIVATQTMQSSPFMDDQLRKEVRLWEGKLKEVSDIIEEVRRCQKAWMYLEPIFSSEDIHKQLPAEGPEFMLVDSYWENQMDLIQQDPGLLDLLDRENIKSMFQGHNDRLEKIQKSLNTYLGQKREIFPRFYFLADGDLLLILAQTKDPLAVQAHMDKCFEGIQKLVFEGKTLVKGMVSAEGEKVMYEKSINVEEGDNKGNVENWLTEVESEMRKCLKQNCIDAADAYVKKNRTDWVKDWPGQVILVISQLFWTQGVEEALRNKKATLRKVADFEKVLQQQIEDIVVMVRGNLSAQLRVTLKALVVLDVHARDVVRSLISKGVTDKDEFDWTAQLRYYMNEKQNLYLCMVNAVINYGYEYLGNSLRLVITSLTDRCYRTLLGAKHLNYGGAPEGPAGTGKTESVKDLAKAIAVQCVVFNCSDGLDFRSMGKFFTGLASSGAWCCFDEFNRIELEVLSVIAQQILTIQSAIADPKTRTFAFEGANVKLNRACAVNITMNPGYAGRSELPDNLKALFRPCAMMVPDYILIAEIELYSFGFSEAKSLATKLVTSLRLSSEQLSSQDHYDFGMRALKSILLACGNLRRQLPDLSEDKLGLLALYDLNLPKFTSNDIPLFLGITSDLFPNIEFPKRDYDVFKDALKNQCEIHDLLAKEDFINKCIQTYETITIRHGIMLVGKAFSGKSTVIKTLSDTLTYLKGKDPMGEEVEKYFINPKSITLGQLYGFNDIDTGEWTDGVLALTITACASSETLAKKWVVFDGPVDAIWIESMNTVLDDNKKLCLTSGSIIKLRPTMTIMFEVEDLAQASLATVSRCGMVYLEPTRLGCDSLIYSYCTKIKTYMEGQHDYLYENLTWMTNLSLLYVSKNWNYPCPTDKMILIDSTIKIFDSMIADYKEEGVAIPKEIDEILPNILLFAFLWGIGGPLHEDVRPDFEKFLNDLVYGEDVVTKYKLEDYVGKYETKRLNVRLPDTKSMFDAYYDKIKCDWIHWNKTIDDYVVPQNVPFNEITVPTEDSIRVAKLMKMLAFSGFHSLFVGPTGTGKTISIVNELELGFDKDKWHNLSLSFSAQTSANQTQDIIDGVMEKRRIGVYGPPLSKMGVVFVDDLNMPKLEKYGAQPPIELLRQWMDYGGWYDMESPEKFFKEIHSIRFVAAMGPPGGGRNFISMRYTRHFVTMYVSPYSTNSLKYIFSNAMESLFMSHKQPAFKKEISNLKEYLVTATIMMYEKVTDKFKPTPTKIHYTYNLRDVSKVFQGIFFANPKGIRSDSEMAKLWAHE